MDSNGMPFGELARLGGVVDEVLSERLGVTVVDGRKIINGDADFFEVEVAKYFAGSGSAWIDDVIFIGADVADDARDFVAYHEYKHYLDYVGRGVIPSNEHASVRSSRLEKECDLYALRRVVRENGAAAAEKAIEWMVNYHFQWDLEHPNDPSDLLYRAVLLYRLCRQNGLMIDPVVNMRKLQKSKRWWR